MFSFKIFHNLKRNDELLRDEITANNPINGLASLLESKSQQGQRRRRCDGLGNAGQTAQPTAV